MSDVNNLAQMREQLRQLDSQKAAADQALSDCSAVISGSARKKGNAMLIFSALLIVAEVVRFCLTGTCHVIELCLIGLFLLIGVIQKIVGIGKFNRLLSLYGDIDAVKRKNDELSAQSQLLKAQRDQLAKEIEKKIDADFQALEQSLKNGHVVTVVTCEDHPSEDDIPREPRPGQKYRDISKVQSLKIYADNSLIATGKSVNALKQKCLICKGAPGNAKNWGTKIHYRLNGASKSWPDPDIALTWVSGMASQFNWHHVSMNSKYCVVYFKGYQTLEDLRKATNLSKEEILKNL